MPLVNSPHCQTLCNSQTQQTTKVIGRSADHTDPQMGACSKNAVSIDGLVGQDNSTGDLNSFLSKQNHLLSGDNTYVNKFDQFCKPSIPAGRGTGDQNSAYLKENNDILRYMMGTLNGIKLNVESNGDKIENLTFRVGSLENHVETQICSLKDRLNREEDMRRELVDKVNSMKNGVYEYIDNQLEFVNDKFTPLIKRIGSDLDDKILKVESHVIESIPECVESSLKSMNLKDHIENSDLTDLIKPLVDHRLKQIESENNKKLETADLKLTEITSENLKLQNEMKQKIKELNELLDKNPPTITTHEHRQTNCACKAELEMVKERSYHNTSWLEGLQNDFDSSSKRIDQIDINSRRNNLIIEQLSEDMNENTLEKISKILDHTLSCENREKVKIRRAFRLGYKLNPNSTRKILVEFLTPEGRDIVHQNVASIRKAGNNGKPYYINEDASEEYKRRKADTNKFANFLLEKGYHVTKSGENLIINGRKFKPEEFNNLPIGDRIQDSRTLSKNGTIAFHSIHSPLSNLYLCKINCEGNVYNSVEQGYQYRKALFHNDTQLARDILRLSNPYDIVSIMKNKPDSPEWCECRISIMERLLKEKADQNRNFRVTLKATDRLKLVEGTRNTFWGAGCPFGSDVIWEGQFKGQNQLGRALERIREGI